MQTPRSNGVFVIMTRDMIFRKSVESMCGAAGLDVVERRGHPQTTALLGELATLFGVKVEQSDVERLQGRLTLAKAFDTVVDVDGVADAESLDLLFTRVMNGQTIPHVTDEEARCIAKDYNGLPIQRRKELKKALLIGNYAYGRLRAENVEEYSKVVLDESALFAEVIALETSPDPAQLTKRQSYNGWLKVFARAGYSVDSLVDLTSDYEQGLTNIIPTAENMYFLAKTALREVRGCFSAAPNGAMPIVVRQGTAKTIRSFLGSLTSIVSP